MTPWLITIAIVAAIIVALAITRTCVLEFIEEN